MSIFDMTSNQWVTAAVRHRSVRYLRTAWRIYLVEQGLRRDPITRVVEAFEQISLAARRATAALLALEQAARRHHAWNAPIDPTRPN